MKFDIQKNGHAMMLLAAASLLVLCWSCREDDDTDLSQPLSLVVAGTDQITVETRADVVRDGKNFSYFNDPDYNIGVFLPPSRATNMGVFKYDETSHTWLTDQRVQSVRVDPGVKYDIYGFMPVGIAGNVSVSGYTKTYPHGLDNPVLHLDGISAVTNQDLCVIVGVGETESDAQLGRFDYTGKTGNAGDGTYDGQNSVFLLVQRLYAGFSFRFSVDADYDNVRSIRVRKITLEGESFSKVDISVTMNSWGTDWVAGSEPIKSIAYAKTDGTATTELFTAPSDTDSEDYGGHTLTTSAWSVPGFFTPSERDQQFRLTAEYDVYDKNGILVRQDCTASNAFTMGNPAQGTQYVINVKVTPTYLYRLSDTDLDNPEMVLSY